MAIKTRQQMLDEDAELKRIDAEINKAASARDRVGDPNKPALLPGYAKTADGSIVSQGQLDSGLASATPFAKTAGPDLTNRVISAQTPSGAIQPGQSFMQRAGQAGSIPLTNQSAMSEVARGLLMKNGGVRQVTGTGMYNVPMSVTAAQQLAHDQEVKAKAQYDVANSNATWALAGQASAARQGAEQAAGKGMTHQAITQRQRQIEQDKTNQGLASAAQAQAQKKMEMDLLGKVGPAQAAAMGGVDQEMVKRGLDPRTGQPFPGVDHTMPSLVENEDGVLIDQNTGKIAPQNAVKQYEAAKAEKASIDKARGLAPVRKHGAITRFFGAQPNVYGYNPTTGEYKQFGSVDELNDKQNKAFRALSSEQQKAYEEGNKGLKSAIPMPTPQTRPIPTPVVVNKFTPPQPATGLQGAPQYNPQRVVRTNQYGNQQNSNVPNMGTQPISNVTAVPATPQPSAWPTGQQTVPNIQNMRPQSQGTNAVQGGVFTSSNGKQYRRNPDGSVTWL